MFTISCSKIYDYQDVPALYVETETIFHNLNAAWINSMICVIIASASGCYSTQIWNEIVQKNAQDPLISSFIHRKNCQVQQTRTTHILHLHATDL